MSKRLIKYGISILLILFVAYHSVYFRKLDEVKNAGASTAFDADKYARKFWENKLIPQLDSAVDLKKLIAALRADPQNAFRNYSHALDIGNTRYFLVQGEGIIQSVSDDAVRIAGNNDYAGTGISIATEFVYGNAIRDASGLIQLNEFTNTTEFNSISESINSIVRKEVLPAFKQMAGVGNQIKFWGAVELNQAHLKLDSVEVVPIRLTILKQ
jgi:predicted lipoprotein